MIPAYLHALQTDSRISCGDIWEFACTPWQNLGCQPILPPRHPLPGISPICLLCFHPTPRGRTSVIFPLDCYSGFLILSLPRILYFLFCSPICCHNHLSKIQIKSHHSPDEVFDGFPVPST